MFQYVINSGHCLVFSARTMDTIDSIQRKTHWLEADSSKMSSKFYSVLRYLDEQQSHGYQNNRNRIRLIVQLVRKSKCIFYYSFFLCRIHCSLSARHRVLWQLLDREHISTYHNIMLPINKHNNTVPYDKKTRLLTFNHARGS